MAFDLIIWQGHDSGKTHGPFYITDIDDISEVEVSSLLEFQQQPILDVLQNKSSLKSLIFSGKRACWSLFLIKLQACRPKGLQLY